MDGLPSIWSGLCKCERILVGLTEPPLFVHACHCLDCQATSGSAFTLSAIVIAESVHVKRSVPDAASLSPRTTLVRCSFCQSPLYLKSTAFPATYVLRMGALAGAFAPQAHIWTRRKQPWVVLPDGVPSFPEGHVREGLWPVESLRRMERAAEDRRASE